MFPLYKAVEAPADLLRLRIPASPTLLSLVKFIRESQETLTPLEMATGLAGTSYSVNLDRMSEIRDFTRNKCAPSQSIYKGVIYTTAVLTRLYMIQYVHAFLECPATN